MDRYRLTERGKLTFGIVLVLVLLVIPSIIILFFAINSGNSQTEVSPSPGPAQHTQDPNGTDPVVSVTPDSSPDPTPDATPEPTETTEPPTPTPTPAGSGDLGDGNGSEAPEFGPVGLNIAEGTMEFIFSPSSQESLDIETVAMLGDFLSSPKNRSGTLVRVEAPDLNPDDESALLSAVKRAFSLYDISDDGLLFVHSGVEATEQSFEVALSFTPVTNQK